MNYFLQSLREINCALQKAHTGRIIMELWTIIVIFDLITQNQGQGWDLISYFIYKILL